MADLIREEMEFFFGIFFTGVMLSAVYDIIRVTRRVFPRKVLIVTLEDILFWIFASLEIFRIIYIYNDGYVRIYAVLTAFLGMYIFECAAGSFLVKTCSKVLVFIRNRIIKVLKFIRNILKKIIPKHTIKRTDTKDKSERRKGNGLYGKKESVR